MRVHELTTTIDLPLSPAEAWVFFSDPRNLEEITPDSLHFRIMNRTIGPMHEGQIIWYRLRLPPGVPCTWVTEITHVREGVYFVDEQRFGPYRMWHHRHEFQPLPDGGVRMTDTVHYILPFGILGSLAHALFVRRQVEGIFSHRAEVLRKRFPGKASA